ncbi:MAG: PP2C family protein-serine/threonine phosphatase, partial [Methanobrevibacter sp.]|nr:PP2C family protein-serine/threonine phosphatase [Methanobrevibacter sp.]
IWISKKIDFIETPKISKRHANKKLYQILFGLLLIATVSLFISLILNLNGTVLTVEVILIGILLFSYLTKPFKHKIQPNDENTVIENIIRNFLIITLIIAIIGVIVSLLSYKFISEMDVNNIYLMLMPTLIITDIIIILFFVPGIIILRYIEKKVIKPISSFSEIERFISENEKIESEGLVKIYSRYLNEKNEIGTLARSYTELINHNNNYIENIREIEGEKERINAELDIATKIQAASLPTEPIKNDDFIVNGYSHPAREVGGDFFDYFMIDEDNLAIVIGDASGKGVPAAIISMITQVIIKQILIHDKDPSKVLYLLNNQLCENNSESMFLTLWLGIYNKTTKKITFSNAGHNPPLIKENGEFKYMNIDSGIVLGIMEDFDYMLEEADLTDELVLYTDGITDANNEEDKMYGETRLLNFFNGFKKDIDPIQPLLNDIHEFTKDAEQYDDMTLLYLKIKDD